MPALELHIMDYSHLLLGCFFVGIFIKIDSDYRMKDFALLKGFDKSTMRKRYFWNGKVRAAVVLP